MARVARSAIDRLLFDVIDDEHGKHTFALLQLRPSSFGSASNSDRAPET
jgi:hypothetical protein